MNVFSELIQRLWTHGLTLTRALGLFSLSRRRFRHHLRILCYHGFDPDGESMFTDIFMTPKRFRERMLWLKSEGYQVLSLGEATRLLQAGALPADSVVLTIDDGFHSVYKYAVPILQEMGFTATIYVTTYYVTHPNPIFRLVVRHMFFCTSLAIDSWRAVLQEVSGMELPDGSVGEVALWDFVLLAERRFTEEQRQECLAALGRRLGVDWRQLVESRRLSLMTPEEIVALSEAGFDIQLHTHRHRFPTEEQVMVAEIEENRAVLSPLVSKPLEHFCYPSGDWSPEQFDVLRRLGVKTATTCDPLLNSPSQPLLGLKRFCDCDQVSLIEFEAVLTGFRAYLNGLMKLRFWVKEHFHV